MIRVTLILGVCAAMATVASSGCTSNVMQDTQTIHNREATRIWVIHRSQGMSSSQDEIVYCDATQPSSSPLCQTWSPR